jgi:hypothetical protein
MNVTKRCARAGEAAATGMVEVVPGIYTVKVCHDGATIKGHRDQCSIRSPLVD